MVKVEMLNLLEQGEVGSSGVSWIAVTQLFLEGKFPRKFRKEYCGHLVAGIESRTTSGINIAVVILSIELASRFSA
jgi:hypothetical protein